MTAMQKFLAESLGTGLVLAVISIGLGMACHDENAVTVSRHAAIAEAINNGVPAESLTGDSAHVVLLFSREGCNVYRFVDSYGAHYFAGRPILNFIRGGADHPCALGH